MTQPRVPAEVTWAAALMLAGAVLSAAWGVLNGVRMGHPSGDLLSGGPGLVLGLLEGAVGCIPWLWTAGKALAGRGWPRVVAVVFFCSYFIAVVPGLVVNSVSSGVVAGVAGELLAGYAAIILLWRPASSDFFLAGRA
jgi:hypothetical protein